MRLSSKLAAAAMTAGSLLVLGACHHDTPASNTTMNVMTTPPVANDSSAMESLQNTTPATPAPMNQVSIGNRGLGGTGNTSAPVTETHTTTTHNSSSTNVESNVSGM